MNAQESIEVLEQKVARLEFEYNMWVEAYNSAVKADYKRASRLYKEHMEQLKAELEPLSICLESAKLFHQHTIPMLQMENEKIGISDPETVFGVPLEDVGIEKGADE